jgi:hypothetical protein
MSSIATSYSDQRIALGRLWWVGLLTTIVSVLVNFVIALITRTLTTVSPAFIPLQTFAFVMWTVIGCVGAIIVFALLARLTQRPIRNFQITALVVLLVSLIPDLMLGASHLYPTTTPLTVGALILMHIATALVCVGLLVNLTRARQ